MTTDKSFSVTDEKLLEYAFKESAKNGESPSYLAKAFKMEDGQEYQISWQIKKMDSPTRSNKNLCPCGHIHEDWGGGCGLKTYCVEGSQCNSDKCAEFVKGGNSE